MRPSHILMTADTVGGVWTYSLELARALNISCGTRTSLATMGAPLTPDQRRQAGEIPGLRIHESEYKLEWMQDPWSDIEAATAWLLRLQDRVRPDLVHINGYAHAVVDWAVPCVVAAHSCVYSWWNAVHGADPPPSWSLYRRVVTAGLRNADAVVAVSETMASALSLHYGISEANVVYNGRPASGFEPARKEEFVLACGRLWDEAKNLAVLDEAAEQVAWPVYIAGESAHPDGGSADLHAARLLGRLEPHELQPWIARAAIFVSPSLYEPFGLAVLEAALSGCALVLSDIESFRELWSGSALFVPPRDVQAIVSAIDAFRTRPELREDYANRARSRAARYSLQRMTKGYLSVYSQARARYEALKEAASCAS
jgi:glycosyltransferase involved in cell wall biosynthesis